MRLLKGLLFLWFCLTGTFCLAQTVQDIRLSGTPADGVRFVAELDKEADVSLSKLNNPPRLVIDFKGTRFDNQLLQKKWPAVGFVHTCRTGTPKPQTARVVLDFPENCQWQEKHFSLPPQSAKNWRFVVDLNRTKTKTTTNATPSTKAETNKQKIIVLDPGHGGQDPGAVSRTGRYEKDLVLMMAKETKKLLEKAGYKVVLTRSKDIFIPLRGRIKKAHEANGDLFISIHADRAKNSSAKGLSIYTISEKASDKEAAALAERENKADILYGMDLAEYQQEVSDILIDLAKTDAMNKSSQYADNVVDEMKKKIRLVPNAHRFAGFVVLKSPNIPSVLLEMGYLSNREEEKQMWQKSYRNKLSQALVNAVNQFFKENP